jgi:Family of unknown function (DUF6516)
LIEDYFRQVDAFITGPSIVHSFSMTYDKRSTYIGFIRGSVYFLDGSVLHLREFVNVQHSVERYMYAYHYQRPDDTFVFRYDNTPHFPALPTFPHHLRRYRAQRAASYTRHDTASTFIAGAKFPVPDEPEWTPASGS